ncbi:alpha/beta-hydrolase [Marasmius fiardii PR-910]|nr:alpha/beta-hydrolase [Marasmius fiardii PR-910]
MHSLSTSSLHFFDNGGNECKELDSTSLKLAARRYIATNLQDDQCDGLTVLFAHCVGSHKEYWEPVIERIFALQNKGMSYRIREAWSFDWQNHGDSAVVNEKILKYRPDGITVYEWANAIRNFVISPRMNGHKLVAIGHSAGAGTMTLSSLQTPLSNYPYIALILVEATMITEDHFYASIEDRMLQMEFTVNATRSRRDTWKSKEIAYEWMLKRFPWNVWDPRIARLMADYGLRETMDPETKESVVTLKCPKEQEAVLYSAVDGHFEAMDELKRVCRTVPVHAIWGENEDIVVEDIRNSLGDISKGRTLASVTTVPDCGHMIVQENPDGLADAIIKILEGIRPPVKGKL